MSMGLKAIVTKHLHESTPAYYDAFTNLDVCNPYLKRFVARRYAVPKEPRSRRRWFSRANPGNNSISTHYRMLPVCVSVAMTRATGSQFVQFVALENGESLPRTANPMLPQSKWQQHAWQHAHQLLLVGPGHYSKCPCVKITARRRAVVISRRRLARLQYLIKARLSIGRNLFRVTCVLL
jgi:hypothetical protein